MSDYDFDGDFQKLLIRDPEIPARETALLWIERARKLHADNKLLLERVAELERACDLAIEMQNTPMEDQR